MANPTVDKVQIEIEGNASKADKVFEKLEANLTKLKSSIQGLKTNGLGTFANDLKKVSDAVDGLTSKANSSSKTTISPKVDTSDLERSARRIQKELDGVTDKFTRMGPLANAALSGDSSALTSFSRQATSLQGDIDVLGSKLQRLGDTRVESDAFKQLERQIETARQKLDEMTTKANSGKIMSNDEYIKLQKDIANASNALDGLIDKQRKMIRDGTAYTDPFQLYRDGVASLQQALNELVGRVNAVKDQKPSVDTSNMIGGIQQTIKWTDNLIRKLLSLGGTAISKAIHGVGNAFKKVKDNISKTHSALGKLNGIFDKGFMKLLKYGLGIRSIYVLFRRLRKAVVESFGELQKSGAFFQTTKANILSLRTALTTLKFQFGAAFEPIFNSVAPALEAFINYMIKAMNVLSAFMAKLSGKSTYSKVASVTLAVANNTGAAAAAAKELNKQLQGFDELNNLTTNDKNGGGGGSGGSGGDTATYTEERIDSALGDFASRLAESINKGDWKGAGELLSAKLTEMMNSIPWDTVFAAASNFGTNLANFLKGLITPDLFYSVGTTVANAIKTALTFLNSFAETLEEVDPETGLTGWEQFGKSLAAGIEGFVESSPLVLAVDTFNKWADGILTTLITAVDTLIEDGTLNKISDDITNALKELEIGEIAWDVGKLVNSLANSVYILVSNKKTWTELGNKIADGINGFFEGMAETDPNTGLNGWEALGGSISETIVGLGTSIITALDSVEWEEVGQAIADFIGSIDFEKVVWVFLNLGVALGKAIIGVIKGLTVDSEGASATLTNVGLIIAAIAGIKFAASITKDVLTTLISSEALRVIGSTVLVKGIGLTLAIGGLVLSDTNLGEGGAKGLASNAAFNLLGATTTYAGLRMMGLPMGLSLKITACTLAWGLGTSAGLFIGEWVAKNLFGENEGGGANGDLHTYYQDFTWKGFIKEVKLSSEEGTLKEAWDKMWDEIYAPVFDEGKQIKLNLDVKFDSLKETITAAKKDFDTMWDSVWHGKSEVSQGYNGAPSDAVNYIEYQQQDAMNEHGYNLWMGIYKGFEKAMTVTNPIVGPIITLKNLIASAFADDNIFGENSPAKAMYPHGADIYYGIIAGFKLAMNNLNDPNFGVNTAIGLLKGLIEGALTTQFTGWNAGTIISKVATLSFSLIPSIEQNAENLNKEAEAIKKKIKDKIGKIESEFKLKNPKESAFSKIKNKIKNFVSGVNKTTSFDLKINVSSNINSLKDWVNKNVIDPVNRTMRQVTPKFEPIKHIDDKHLMATGGVLTKATDVIAGEAGSEAIVPLERNLGWLKIMSNMMLDGMESASKLRYTANPYSYGFTGTVNGMSSMSASDKNNQNDELLAEQNRILKEQNKLLQQIASKDLSISSRDIYSATLSEARNINNRSGNSPLLF